MNAVPVLVEAISALSQAAGLFEGRGDTEPAHRCDQAAAGLQAFVLDMMETEEAEEA